MEPSIRRITHSLSKRLGYDPLDHGRYTKEWRKITALIPGQDLALFSRRIKQYLNYKKKKKKKFNIKKQNDYKNETQQNNNTYNIISYLLFLLN